MKFGLNLWIWDAPFRTDKHMALIPQVRALGGEVVEFALEDDAVVDTKLLRRSLADEGLACSVVGLFGPDRDLSSDDANARRDGLDYARRCIDVCAGVGATIFTGAVAGVGGKALLSDEARPARFDRTAQSLRELGDYASQAGVRVTVEILNRYESNFLTTAAQGRQLIDLTAHPAVGIHLDSFHMNLEENNLGDAIRLAGDKLIHVLTARLMIFWIGLQWKTVRQKIFKRNGWMRYRFDAPRDPSAITKRHGSESHRGTPGSGVLPSSQPASSEVAPSPRVREVDPEVGLSRTPLPHHPMREEADVVNSATCLGPFRTTAPTPSS